ncbi:MAG: DUF1189 domain-containing protein [Elusimicrobiaceae bacterium]|nr:DUF1189 domain-containing protein [Elusimicrobiaceae bacterium]
MFFISPIKAVYSIKFYLQTLKEPLWKALLFFVYLFALGSIFLALYTPIKVTPFLNEVVGQIAEITPEINIKQGVITVNDNKRLEIAPEVLQGYKIIFDTASEEPGYPTQMEKENIFMYVNKNKVYTSYNGQFQENEIPANANLNLSKEVLLAHQTQYVNFIVYFMTVVFILAFLFRLILLIVLALIVIFFISAVAKKNIDFKKMLTLAIYMQAPILILDFILMLLSVNILGISTLISIIIYVIYTNLILARMNPVVPVKEENNQEVE